MMTDERERERERGGGIGYDGWKRRKWSEKVTLLMDFCESYKSMIGESTLENKS